MTARVERCEQSDLPVGTCGGTCCAPDAEVLPSTGAPLSTGEQTAPRTSPPRRAARPSRPILNGLAHELTRCPQLHDDLGDMANGARSDEPERVSGGDTESKPAPARADVIEHRHKLVLLLRAELARVTPAGPPPLDMPVTRMAGHLIVRLPDTEDGQQLLDDLRDWRARAQQLLDLPRLRSRIPLGACPHAADELWSCDGLLWANIPADWGQAAWVSCDSCRDRWDAVALPGVADVVLPLRDVSELCGVPRGTLWHWIDDGYLMETDAGVRLGDVLARLESHDPRQPA